MEDEVSVIKASEYDKEIKDTYEVLLLYVDEEGLHTEKITKFELDGRVSSGVYKGWSLLRDYPTGTPMREYQDKTIIMIAGGILLDNIDEGFPGVFKEARVKVQKYVCPVCLVREVPSESDNCDKCSDRLSRLYFGDVGVHDTYGPCVYRGLHSTGLIHITEHNGNKTNRLVRLSEIVMRRER